MFIPRHKVCASFSLRRRRSFNKENGASKGEHVEHHSIRASIGILCQNSCSVFAICISSYSVQFRTTAAVSHRPLSHPLYESHGPSKDQSTLIHLPASSSGQHSTPPAPHTAAGSVGCLTSGGDARNGLGGAGRLFYLWCGTGRELGRHGPCPGGPCPAGRGGAGGPIKRRLSWVVRLR